MLTKSDGLKMVIAFGMQFYKKVKTVKEEVEKNTANNKKKGGRQQQCAYNKRDKDKKECYI